MELDLKRTREKLETMATTPHMFWILGDMVELVADDVFGEPVSDFFKIQLVERLKNRYEKYIKENETQNNKQGFLEL